MNPPTDPTGRPHFDQSDALYPTTADDAFVPYATAYPFEPPVPLGYWGTDISLVLPAATFQHGHGNLPIGPTTSMSPAYGFGSYPQAGTAYFDPDPNHPMSPSICGDRQLLCTTAAASANLGDTESLWWTGFRVHGHLGKDRGINHILPVHVEPTGQPVVAADAERTSDSMLPVNVLAASETPPPPNPFPGRASGSDEKRSEQLRRRHSAQEVERSLTGQEYGRRASGRTARASPSTQSLSPIALRRPSTSTIETGSGGLRTKHKNTVRARASLRYRAKTHMRLVTLEMAEQEAGTQNQALRACADRLRQEAFKLKNDLLEQSTCNCPLIRNFLAQEAERVVDAMRKKGPEGVSRADRSCGGDDFVAGGPHICFPNLPIVDASDTRRRDDLAE
ncbi:hypothetical protein VTG60DRAFT_2504 [Thermothelomyces hinnuleus]